MPVVYNHEGIKVYVATVIEAAELVQIGTHSFQPPEEAERDEASEVKLEDLAYLDGQIENSHNR